MVLFVLSYDLHTLMCFEEQLPCRASRKFFARLESERKKMLKAEVKQTKSVCEVRKFIKESDYEFARWHPHSTSLTTLGPREHEAKRPCTVATPSKHCLIHHQNYPDLTSYV